MPPPHQLHKPFRVPERPDDSANIHGTKEEKLSTFLTPPCSVGECGLGGFRGKVMSDSNADTAAEPLKELHYENMQGIIP